MKKNTMMRLASVLLVAVLLSTCAISGTFAKYVTEGSATDSARVAKWGVNIVAEGNAFAGNYYSYENGNGIHTEMNVSTDTVNSEGGNVVAPGTHGGMASFVITGKPEVDFRVDYSANFSIGDQWTDGTNYYCPIIIHVTKLDGSVTSVYGTNYPDAADFAEAVNQTIADASFRCDAGTDLTAMYNSNSKVSVSWEWPFETGADDAAKAANNVKDTYLGNQAANGNAAQLYLEITATATQID